MTFIEQASDAIRDSGGRMTRQRRIIIEQIAGAQWDAESLYAELTAAGEEVSLATVYRTLSVLEGAGLLQQRYLSPDHERRVYVPLTTLQTHHFTCKGCGKVIPFETDIVGRLSSELAAGMGLQVTSGCICVEGYCVDCQEETT
ncbi:MAG: transcriptional repressor [Chloroflexi bacterium]|nr:transcriptional repressor [Chloroflexota bacterium]